MSRQIRTLIGVVAALVVVGGGLCALLLLPGGKGTDPASSSSPVSDTTITLLDKSKDAAGKSVEDPVKKVAIKTRTESFVLSPGEEGGLRVEAYADLRANTPRMTSLVGYLKTIKALQKITGDTGRPADFGFGETASDDGSSADERSSEPDASSEDETNTPEDADGQTAWVTVTYHDDTTYRFEIGRESPGDSGYYFRETGSSDIYLVSTYFAQAVAAPSTDYVSPTLFVAPTVNSDDSVGQAILQTMELSGTLRNEVVSLRRVTEKDTFVFQGTDYVLTKPYLIETDADKIKTLLAGTSLTAAGVELVHPTKADLEKYGLTQPQSIAVIELAVEKIETTTDADGNSVESTTFYNRQTHTIRLGGKNSEGYYYALVDDLNAVYLLMPSAVPWATALYDELVNPTLFMRMITDIETLSLTIDGKETVFTFTHYPEETDRNLSLVVTMDGQTYSTPNMRKLYQVLMRVKRIGPADGIPAGEPDMIIRITPLKNSTAQPVEARLYKLSGSLYVCQQANGDTYQVTARSVNEVVTQLQNYLSGAEVVTS